MKILVDTNVLTRMAEPGHAQNRIAADAIEALGRQGHELAIVPQVLYEFWSVCTRPLSANGLGRSVDEAIAEIAKIKSFFRLLAETPSVLAEWESRVSAFRIIGRDAHDAHLVSAMVVHGMTHILTFNAHDFRRFSDISVLDAALSAAP
jgi:predicted nucleic acid-binding protein